MDKIYFFGIIISTFFFINPNKLNAQVLSSKGKDFWLGFMQNEGADVVTTSIYISSDVATTGTVSVPGAGWSQNYSVGANATVQITIPTNLVQATLTESIESKGVHVTAVKPVSVYALNYQPYTSDATLIFPTESLGDLYYVAAYKSLPGLESSYPSQLLVVATANATQIQITPSATTLAGKPANVPFNITLNAGQVYQIKAATDLTGTKITTNGNNNCKYFAVFGGSLCTNVGGCAYCDHLYEEMPPVSKWGKDFITVPFKTRSFDVFRVVASQNATTVTIGAFTINLNAGGFYEANAGNPLYVHADKPIMLTQYSIGQECDGANGDPFFIVISPVEQSIDNITFNAFNSSVITNYYVNVVAKTADVASVLLDGAPQSAQFSVVAGNPTFSYAQIDINSGNHTLNCPNGLIAYVYGYGGYESYGYAAGMNLISLAASFDVDYSNEISNYQNFIKVVCSNDPVEFIGAPNPNITTYSWLFGDGGSATGQTVTHEYVNEGLYLVSMIVDYAQSCTPDTLQLLVLVRDPDITIESKAICTGTSTTLTAPIGGTLGYKWSTGATTQSINVSPSQTTTYDVSIYNPFANCNGTNLGSYTVEIIDLSIQTSKTDPTCNNSNDGTITITTNGCLPGGVLSYSVNGGIYQSSNVLNGLIAGSYTVTARCEYKGASCTKSANITLNNPAPIPNPTNPIGQSFCLGQTVPPAPLAATGNGYTLNWYASGNALDLTILSGGANTNTYLPNPLPIGNTTYYVEATDGTCKSNNRLPVTLTVNVPPFPSISGPTQVCTGGQVNLNLVDSYASAAWSNGGGNNNSATYAGAGTYNVSVTDVNGCTGSTYITVTNFTPSTPTISGNLEICSGQSTTLNTSIYNQYNWSDAAGNNLGNGLNISVNAGGAYSVTITDGNNCTASVSTNVIENPLPTPLINADTTICAGETSLLDVGNYSNYNWSNGATSSSISTTTAGQFEVTVTDINGCTQSTTTNIIVYPTPTPTISGTFTVCTQDTATLIADSVYTNYAWTPAANNNDTIFTTNAGSYSLIVTDTNGCTQSTSTLITLNPLPTPTISGDTVICVYETTTFDAGNYSNYNWSNGSTNASISLNIANQYSVTVTDSNGCTATVSQSLYVNPQPTPTITGPSGFCTGTNFALHATAGYTAYNWSNGGGTDSIATFNSPGNYTVTVTNSNNCTQSAAFNILENQNPVPLISGSDSVCFNTVFKLMATPGYAAYTWSNSGGNIDSASFNLSGMYSLSVTDVNGCTGSATFSVAILPDLLPLITGPSDFCKDTSFILDAGAGYNTYAWSNNGGNNQTATFTNAGNYTVTVTNAIGCTGTGTHSITVLPDLTPIIVGNDSICNNTIATLDAGNGYKTYLWSDNGGNNQTAAFANAGNYTVTVTNFDGCSGTANYTVNLFPSPVPQISGPSSICINTLFTLDAGSGYTSYLWSDSSSAQTLQLNQSGTYSVTITDINGCTGSDEHTIIVLPNLEPTISGDTTFCENQSVTLTVNETYAGYTWSDNGNNETATFNETGTYSVTVVDANGCTGSALHSITAIPIPEAPQVSGNNSPYCIDSTIAALSATTQYNGVLTWYSDANLTQIVHQGNDFYPPSAQSVGIISYWVTETNKGCESPPTQVDIEIISCLCPIIVNYSPNAVLCSGTEVTLNVEILDPDNNLEAVIWTSSGTQEQGFELSYTASEVIAGCLPQTFYYTFDLYCKFNLNEPNQSIIFEVTYFPIPEASVQLTNNGCTMQIVPTCPNYTVLLGDVLSTNNNGDNSSHSFTVANIDAMPLGLDCTTTITGTFNCVITDCPTINTATAPASVCNGDAINLNLTVNDADNLLGKTEWLRNGQVISNNPSFTDIQLNTGCNPINISYTGNIYCTENPNIIQDSRSIQVAVYPDYNITFLNQSNTECSIPTLVSTCNNYVIENIDVPTTIAPGDAGTAVFNVSYNTAACFNQTVEIDYNCPYIPHCFTVNTLITGQENICNGDAPNFTGFENQIPITDIDATFNNWQWYTDAALSDPLNISDYTHSGNNCDVNTVTLYIGGICKLNNLPIYAGKINVTIFPDYDLNLLQATTNDCTVPTLITSCANYTITPISIPEPPLLNGSSGTATWKVTFNANGFNCWTETYDVGWVCGDVCPIVVLNQNAATAACNGETLLMSVNVTPADAVLNTDYTLQWQLNGTPVLGANNLTFEPTVSATSCNTNTYNYSVVYTCLVPGDAPKTIESGTTTVYPDYDATLVSSNNTTCDIPTIQTSCPNYIITPVSVPSVINPGDNGTAVWEISYNEANCLENQIVTSNFNCPYIPLCFTIDNIVTVQNILCNGDAPDFNGFVTAVALTDIDNTFGGWQWFSDSTLSVPMNVNDYSYNGNNCDPYTQKLYLGALCTLNSSLTPAGTLTVTIYPDFDASLLQSNSSDCQVPTVIANCLNYTITPVSLPPTPLQNGTSGTATYNISYNLNNLLCWTETYNVGWVCGDVCPIVTINQQAPTQACTGENILLSVNITPSDAILNTDYTLQWQLNGNNITGANDLTYTTSLNANGCSPISQHFTVVYTCLVPGDAPKTIDAGTVNIYPNFEASFVSTTSTTCDVPSITVNCPNYLVTPINVPNQVLPGEQGTAIWEITYNGANCFTAQTLSATYNCPPLPVCFTVVNLANQQQTLCNGEAPNLETIEIATQINDPDTTFLKWQWYADAALTNPINPLNYAYSGNNCDVFTTNLYLGGICSINNLPITAGLVSITVYPDFEASLLQSESTDCALPTLISNCNNYSLTPLSMPTLPMQNGTSGLATWQVTYTANGFNCWIDTIEVGWVCGDVCPIAVVNAPAPNSACNGEQLLLSVNITPTNAILNTDYTLQWQLNGNNIAGANNLTYTPVVSANGCEPTVNNYTVVYTCLIPGDAPTTLNAGTTTVYPTFDNSLVSAFDGNCVPPTIINTCDNYILTPNNLPDTVAPGNNGTTFWQIIYANSTCIDTTISANYNCAPICPIITQNTSLELTICDGNIPDITSAINSVQYNDPNNTFNGFEWYTDAALTQVGMPTFNFTNPSICEPQTINAYLGLKCSINNQVIFAGKVSVIVYPLVTGVTINNGCEFIPNIANNCNGNLIVEYSTNGIDWVNSNEVNVGSWQMRAYLLGTPDNDLNGMPDCTLSDIFTIYPADTAAFDYGNLSYCAGDPNPLPIITGTLGGTFTATNNLKIDSISGFIDLNNVLNSDTFIINYTTNGFCPASSNQTITIIKPDLSIFAGNDITICEGDTAHLNAQLTGIGTVKWTAIKGIFDNPNSLNTNYGVKNSGLYTLYVTATDECGGSYTDSLLLIVEPTVHLTVTGETDILEGQQTQLVVSGGKAYWWSPPQTLSCHKCNNPIAAPIDTTTYFVITNSPCSDTGQITINVIPIPNIEIPTAFSPNNDNINDTYKPVYKGNIVNYDFIIYNRWGQQVFKTKDIKEGWNGMFNDKDAPIDTYVWSITVEFDNGDAYRMKGNVTLIR